MRKLLFMLSFVATGLVATAQTTPAQKERILTVEQKATSITNRMVKELGLTPDQKTKVHNVTMERIKKMDVNREKNSANKDVFEKEKSTIMTEWDNQLKTILTPAQHAKMVKLVEERNKKQGKSED